MQDFIQEQHNQPSENQPVVSVRHLSKKYCRSLRSSLWHGIKDIAREIFFPNRTNSNTGLRKDEFWALRDISFDLKKGESIAIIGDNGSGKSTLLKLLYGLIRPDTGQIAIKGRVEAMIELHSGLDPILTGRENIYVKASLYGMSSQEVNEIVDDIINFAEISEFIDSPVQFYSSGMLSRLGYSIAAHLNPDILLIDEVLAVGDFNFQRKCLNHLLNFISNGGSLILVSHDPHHIQFACQKAILLEKGKIIRAGTAIETLNFYLQPNNLPEVNSIAGKPVELSEEKPLRIDKITIESEPAGEIKTGDQAKLTVSYRSLKNISHSNWYFSIWTDDNRICVAGSDLIPAEFEQGTGSISAVITSLNLTAGDYLLKIALGLDDDFQYPLAISGWEDAPTAFTVSTNSSKMVNAQLAQKQLTVLSVKNTAD